MINEENTNSLRRVRRPRLHFLICKILESIVIKYGILRHGVFNFQFYLLKVVTNLHTD